MSISSHTWVVGEIVTAANMNTYLRDNISDLDGRIFEMETGSYTGDGTLSKVVSLSASFTVTYVKIWPQETADAQTDHIFETTDAIIDDNVNGMAWKHNSVTGGGIGHVSVTHAIIALGAGSFTVDDAGGNLHPNNDGHTYNYVAMG